MTEQEINIDVARKLGHSEEEISVWIGNYEYGMCYCQDIEAALEIVEQVKSAYQFMLDWDRERWCATFIDKPENSWSALADAAPMAICLAFLKLP